MPGGLVGLGARTSARLSLANRMRPVFNTTVTNMPGPQHPLYMAGAQLVAMYVVGMIIEGMGLIHPVTSYCGDITISFTSCREMLPDPGFYADCIRESFDSLSTAASELRRKAEHPRQSAGGSAPSSPVVQSTAAAATNVTALRVHPPDPVEERATTCPECHAGICSARRPEPPPWPSR